MRPINSYFDRKIQILNEKLDGESNQDVEKTQLNQPFEEITLLDGRTIPASAGGTMKF